MGVFIKSFRSFLRSVAGIVSLNARFRNSKYGYRDKMLKHLFEWGINNNTPDLGFEDTCMTLQDITRETRIPPVQLMKNLQYLILLDEVKRTDFGREGYPDHYFITVKGQLSYCGEKYFAEFIAATSEGAKTLTTVVAPFIAVIISLAGTGGKLCRPFQKLCRGPQKRNRPNKAEIKIADKNKLSGIFNNHVYWIKQTSE